MMMRRCVLTIICLTLVGCRETHEVDLTRTPDFQWTGKVRVNIAWDLFSGWQVESIELPSEDGRVARLGINGQVVKATVDLPVKCVSTQPSSSQPNP